MDRLATGWLDTGSTGAGKHGPPGLKNDNLSTLTGTIACRTQCAGRKTPALLLWNNLDHPFPGYDQMVQQLDIEVLTGSADLPRQADFIGRGLRYSIWGILDEDESDRAKLKPPPDKKIGLDPAISCTALP
jgi:hypothetical protein